MRILMVAACPLPWPRGTPIRIHRMAEALFDRGHEVHVVTYPLGDETQAIPYAIHRVGDAATRMDPRPGPSFKKFFYLDPLLRSRIRRLLDAGPFDVIHAHHYESLIASLVARRSSQRTPIIYDAHTLLASELPYYARWLPAALLARIGRMLDLRVPRRADHIVAVTDHMQHWFVNDAGLAPDRVTVIPNGVEHEHFETGRGDAPRAAGGPRILFAGNLAGYQGLDLLLDAFVQVRDARPDAGLYLLGGSAPDALRKHIDDLGIASSVFFEEPDYVSLPARLALADVLVNPRVDCHGIPQKLLNYMATGRPIVSFASSAALLENERDGLIVPDGDTDGFADAILRLIHDARLARVLGDASKAKVVARHSWDAVAAEVEAVYTRLTGPGR